MEIIVSEEAEKNCWDVCIFYYFYSACNSMENGTNTRKFDVTTAVFQNFQFSLWSCRKLDRSFHSQMSNDVNVRFSSAFLDCDSKWFQLSFRNYSNSEIDYLVCVNIDMKYQILISILVIDILSRTYYVFLNYQFFLLLSVFFKLIENNSIRMICEFINSIYRWHFKFKVFFHNNSFINSANFILSHLG